MRKAHLVNGTIEISKRSADHFSLILRVDDESVVDFQLTKRDLHRVAYLLLLETTEPETKKGVE